MNRNQKSKRKSSLFGAFINIVFDKQNTLAYVGYTQSRHLLSDKPADAKVNPERSGLPRSWLLRALLLLCCSGWAVGAPSPEFAIESGLAQSGDARAQYELGRIYLEGEEIPRDYRQAERWFRQSAEQGSPLGHFGLGVLYANGHGVWQSHEAAASHFQFAADRGVAMAQFYLGVLHLNGQGVSQDAEAGYRWIEKAASQGVPEAMVLLGKQKYRQRSFSDAAGWLLAGEASLDGEAAEYLAHLFKEGLGVHADQGRARSYLERAASQGRAEAQWQMGGIYMNGVGVGSDVAKAASYYRLAAEQGHVNSMAALGALLKDKTYGLVPQPSEARAWMEKAAREKHPLAQYLLGGMLLAGEGGSVDHSQGIDWLTLSAEAGVDESRQGLEHLRVTQPAIFSGAQSYRIAYFHHQQGRPTEWVPWLRLSAEANEPEAQWWLARVYRDGVGVERDASQARGWLERAAHQGHAQAQNDLGVLLRQASDVENARYWFARAAQGGNAQAQANLDAMWRDGPSSPSSKPDMENDLAAVIGIIFAGVVLHEALESHDAVPAASGLDPGRTAACKAAVEERLVTCQVNLGNCTGFGCSMEADCDRGWRGNDCEAFLGNFVSSWEPRGTYYCDSQSSRNSSQDLEQVVRRMCAD